MCVFFRSVRLFVLREKANRDTKTDAMFFLILLPTCALLLYLLWSHYDWVAWLSVQFFLAMLYIAYGSDEPHAVLSGDRERPVYTAVEWTMRWILTWGAAAYLALVWCAQYSVELGIKYGDAYATYARPARTGCGGQS